MVMMMVMMAKLMTMAYIVTMFTIIDDDFDYMTININHGYGNNFEVNHLQDVDMRKGVGRLMIMIRMIKLMIMGMVILT